MNKVNEKIKEIKHTHKFGRSLAIQVLLVFVVGLCLTMLLSYVTSEKIAEKTVLREKKEIADSINDVVEGSIKEVTAYEWVLGYLLTHLDSDLDLEYDSRVKSDEKLSEFLSEHPGIVLEKVTEEELDAFSEEDQKCYVEIIYNRWIRRLNHLKEYNGAEFLYLIATDDSFEESIFIMSATDRGRERGTGEDDSYVFGKTSKNRPDIIDAFKELQENGESLVTTDSRVSQYFHLFDIGGLHIINGMTFAVAGLKDEVGDMAFSIELNFAFLLILLAAFCLLMISIYAIFPLRRLIMFVSEYGENKDTEATISKLENIRTGNEIGELSGSIAEMIDELHSYMQQIKKITAEQEREKTEMTLAANIQQSMLPHTFPAFPDRSEIDIYGSMSAAKGIGGDFYDYFFIDPDHLCLIIADVSGKGIPGALFMMISDVLLQEGAIYAETVSDILAGTNDMLCKNNEAEMFVTAWLAVLEISTGKMRAANAGHEYPVVKRAGGRYELYKDRHGFVLGGMPGTKYREYEIILKPGDCIFVYTDGVPEATNSAEQLFGIDRMIEALNQEEDASVEMTCRNVRRNVDLFVGEAPQFDDLTMLCMKYNGPSAEKKDGEEG